MSRLVNLARTGLGKSNLSVARLAENEMKRDHKLGQKLLFKFFSANCFVN
jgi:hypothetical protein